MAVRDALQGVGIGSVFGVAADLLLTGGDLVFFLIVDQGPILFLFLSRLLAAAPSIGWLPESRLQTAFTALALVLAIVTLYRFSTNIAEFVRNRA